MRMKCGHCKGVHATVAEVRSCASMDLKAPEFVTAIQDAERAEDERVAAFKAYQFEGSVKGGGGSVAVLDRPAPRAVADPDVARQAGSKGWLPGKIVRCPECDVMRNVFHKPGCSLGGTQEPAKAITRPTEDEHAGMYRNPSSGAIYKVQKAVHGSGHLYAKRLVQVSPEGSGDPAAYFEMERGAIFKIDLSWRMTLAEAKEYGALYGVCCRCARTLTDEGSIEAGIGPVCASKV